MPCARPIRLPAAALAVAAVVAATGLTGCSPDRLGASGAAPSVATTPASDAGSTPSGRPGSAAALLATITVKGRAPVTGYRRAEFGTAWTDDTTDLLGHNGCDTRNDILRRDLISIVLRPGSNGCTVLFGTLHDPYTRATISFTRGASTSGAVQIDHVVALGDAWQTGADRWTEQTRTELANDPLELLAVDGPTNEAKGDGDAATWLPPNTAFRCAYVARQVAVKARYRLWMTQAEHDATARVLSACPGQAAPTESSSAQVRSSTG